MKLSSQKINPAKAAGLWHDITIDGETIGFKIASQKSPEYQRALIKLADQEKLKAKLGHVDLEKSLMENKERAQTLFATHILLDWRGITDDAGKEIPYSLELAKQLVDENVYPLIAEFIVRKSQETEHYMGEVIKEAIDDAKNE